MSKENVPFKLVRIKTEQFATIDEVNPTDEVDISAKIDFGMDDEDTSLLCSFSCSFESKGEKFILLKILCEFKIAEPAFEKSLKMNENKYVFPKAFMQHLGVIAVGTARGVLHCKTEGTPFNQYFLPTINLTEMLTEDVTFEVEE